MTTANCDKTAPPPCNNCCKKCKDCPNCYDYDTEKLRQYLFSIDGEITQYNQSSICIEDWGYGCKPITKDSFEKLIIYRSYIRDHYNSLRLGYTSGVCPNEIQRVLESTSKLINLNFYVNQNTSNVAVDDTNFEAWVLNNPTCVAWEDWEKSIIQVCPKIGITVKVESVKDVCNFIYDIQVNKIEQACKLLYTLSIAEIAKKEGCFDINFKVNEKKCKSDYTALVTEFKCNFDFQTYINLLSCNLSHKVISNLLECRLKVDYSAKDKCPVIKTKNGKYNLTDVDVNVFEDKADITCLTSLFGTLSQEEIEELTNSYTNSHAININING